MKKLVLLIPFLFAASPADATHCYSQSYVAPAASYSYQQAYAATYYTPVVYPVYSIGYTPPNNESLKEELLRLKVELRDLTIQQLQLQLKLGPGQAQQPAPQPVSKAVGVFVQSCVKCHSEDRAKDSGGGFILLQNGGIGHLTASDRLEIIRRVISDDVKIKMPRGGSLPDPDVVAIVQEMSGNGPPQMKQANGK